MGISFYSMIFFIFGTLLGSFYNVVGYRLPKKESIVFPPSHCTKCNTKLKVMDLIPIFSYLFLKGKCRNCKEEISILYPFMELLTGFLFFVSYIVFGLTSELIISLIFVSFLVIVFVSDIRYMIIPDEVTVFFLIAIVLADILINGISIWKDLLLDITIPFLFLIFIKTLGDVLFKKDTLGGGDIKLMLVVGALIGWENAIVAVFLGSIIAFPISFFYYFKDKEHILPFGPYLCIGALIISYIGLSAIEIIRLFY